MVSFGPAHSVRVAALAARCDGEKPPEACWPVYCGGPAIRKAADHFFCRMPAVASRIMHASSAAPNSSQQKLFGHRTVSSHPFRAAALTPTPTPTPPGGFSGIVHYHLDHLGSVHLITNPDGSVFEYIRYRPYGEPRGHYDANGNQQPTNTCGDDGYCREFTGYDSEPVSGLQYAGARFYDPALGMFLTHDPARQFASPYAYGAWSPINGTDPTGAFWDELVIALSVVFPVWAGFTFGVPYGQARLNGTPEGQAATSAAISAGISGATAAGLGVLDIGVRIAAVNMLPYLHAAEVASGVYSIYQSFNTGQYLVGSVGAVMTAFGIYGLSRDFAQGGNGAGSLPDPGAPGSPNDAFYRTSDPLCVGSAVCDPNARFDVSDNGLIRELRADFSAKIGNVSDARVTAVPPAELGPYSGQTVGADVEIRNDLFSTRVFPSSARLLGHEFAHVLQGRSFFFGLSYRFQNLVRGYYNNPFEVQADLTGIRFAQQYAPNLPFVSNYGTSP